MKFKINPEIFRAYDIRGIYPLTLNEETAFLIGQAFVKFLSQKSKVKSQKLNIIVGRDGRLSSPALFKALTKGIIDQGGNVIDIGLVITPMLYFAVAHFKVNELCSSPTFANAQAFDGGIEISASHNPPEYNGFKLVREKAIPISEKSGLEEIKNLVLKSHFKKRKKGKIIKKEVLKDYLQFNLKDFDLKQILPLKIVIDTANAVPGMVVPEFFRKTKCKIYHLFSKLDGNFPNHYPNPLIKENLKFLQEEVKKRKANLGVAFDGDGDRIAFVAENGEIISGDFITSLIADLILAENPKAKILYDVRSSNVVRETIERGGGLPIVSRIGHSFIKEKMRKEKAIFGGEFSGHYYHKNHYFSEAPFFVLLKILIEMTKSKKRFSEIISNYQKYFHSGEINFKVKNKKRILELLERKYKKRTGAFLKIDGLRVDFKNWWFLVRASGTEDILRLVIEAKTRKLMEEKKKEMSSFIKEQSRS